MHRRTCSMQSAKRTQVLRHSSSWQRSESVDRLVAKKKTLETTSLLKYSGSMWLFFKVCLQYSHCFRILASWTTHSKDVQNTNWHVGDSRSGHGDVWSNSRFITSLLMQDLLHAQPLLNKAGTSAGATLKLGIRGAVLEAPYFATTWWIVPNISLVTGTFNYLQLKNVKKKYISPPMGPIKRTNKQRFAFFWGIILCLGWKMHKWNYKMLHRIRPPWFPAFPAKSNGVPYCHLKSNGV